MKRNGFILVASDNSKIGGWSEEDRSIHFVKSLIFEVLDDDVDTSFNPPFYGQGKLRSVGGTRILGGSWT